MSAEDLEKYETEMELQLYREYRDVVGLFSHVVETERRFYLTNDVDLKVRTADNGEVFFEVTMQDAWVWDMYRPARFVKNVRVVTFKDVNIEELAKSDLQLPDPDDKQQGLSWRRPPERRAAAGLALKHAGPTVLRLYPPSLPRLSPLSTASLARPAGGCRFRERRSRRW